LRPVQRSVFWLLLVALGCSAQSASNSDVNRRVEHLLRAHYNIPASVNIAIGPRRPSSEFPTYDLVQVTLSRADKTTTREFLLSKDGQTLKQLVNIDDPTEKIDLKGRPWRGAKDAKVTVITYDDFQCPFCSRNHQTMFDALLKSYGDRVRFVYKDLPLATLHPWATRAAIDSNCLNAQSNDAYWDFADYVHANQRAITGAQRTPPTDPSPEKVKEFQQQAATDRAGQFARLDGAAQDAARKHGLDLPRLQACLKSQPDDAVKASLAEAETLGLDSTPVNFVNGVKLDGAVPEEDFRKALDQALRTAGQPAGPAGASGPNDASGQGRNSN